MKKQTIVFLSLVLFSLVVFSFPQKYSQEMFRDYGDFDNVFKSYYVSARSIELDDKLTTVQKDNRRNSLKRRAFVTIVVEDVQKPHNEKFVIFYRTKAKGQMPFDKMWFSTKSPLISSDLPKGQEMTLFLTIDSVRKDKVNDLLYVSTSDACVYYNGNKICETFTVDLRISFDEQVVSEPIPVNTSMPAETPVYVKHWIICRECRSGKVAGEKENCGKCHGRGEVLTKCNNCNGSGKYKSQTITCTRCNGIGRRVLFNGNTKSNVSCTRCSGDGKIDIYDTCRSCHGRGQVYISCNPCDGTGKVTPYTTCTSCKGSGQLWQ